MSNPGTVRYKISPHDIGDPFVHFRLLAEENVAKLKRTSASESSFKEPNLPFTFPNDLFDPNYKGDYTNYQVHEKLPSQPTIKFPKPPAPPNNYATNSFIHMTDKLGPVDRWALSLNEVPVVLSTSDIILDKVIPWKDILYDEEITPVNVIYQDAKLKNDTLMPFDDPLLDDSVDPLIPMTVEQAIITKDTLSPELMNLKPKELIFPKIPPCSYFIELIGRKVQELKIQQESNKSISAKKTFTQSMEIDPVPEANSSSESCTALSKNDSHSITAPYALPCNTISIELPEFALEILHALSNHLFTWWKNIKGLNLAPFADPLKTCRKLSELKPRITRLCLVKLKEEIVEARKDPERQHERKKLEEILPVMLSMHGINKTMDIFLNIDFELAYSTLADFRKTHDEMLSNEFKSLALHLIRLYPKERKEIVHPKLLELRHLVVQHLKEADDRRIWIRLQHYASQVAASIRRLLDFVGVEYIVDPAMTHPELSGSFWPNEKFPVIIAERLPKDFPPALLTLIIDYENLFNPLDGQFSAVAQQTFYVKLPDFFDAVERKIIFQKDRPNPSPAPNINLNPGPSSIPVQSPSTNPTHWNPAHSNLSLSSRPAQSLVSSPVSSPAPKSISIPAPKTISVTTSPASSPTQNFNSSPLPNKLESSQLCYGMEDNMKAHDNYSNEYEMEEYQFDEELNNESLPKEDIIPNENQRLALSVENTILNARVECLQTLYTNVDDTNALSDLQTGVMEVEPAAMILSSPWKNNKDLMDALQMVEIPHSRIFECDYSFLGELGKYQPDVLVSCNAAVIIVQQDLDSFKNVRLRILTTSFKCSKCWIVVLASDGTCTGKPPRFWDALVGLTRFYEGKSPANRYETSFKIKLRLAADFNQVALIMSDIIRDQSKRGLKSILMPIDERAKWLLQFRQFNAVSAQFIAQHINPHPIELITTLSTEQISQMIPSKSLRKRIKGLRFALRNSSNDTSESLTFPNYEMEDSFFGQLTFVDKEEQERVEMPFKRSRLEIAEEKMFHLHCDSGADIVDLWNSPIPHQPT